MVWGPYFHVVDISIRDKAGRNSPKMKRAKIWGNFVHVVTVWPFLIWFLISNILLALQFRPYQDEGWFTKKKYFPTITAR